MSMLYCDHTRTEKGNKMDIDRLPWEQTLKYVREEKNKILHISDTVKVLEKKNINKILHNKIGIIISMIGDTFPFMYSIKIGDNEYCFKGNEIEIVLAYEDFL